MLCNRISGSWQCTETVAPVGNPRGEMPSIGHPRRRVSKPHCRCAGRLNGWTWGSEERQAVAGGTRSCLDSCVKPSRRSPLGETRENHMVTQRFWSSAIYLATSNSHASGIVGPRHDHMAIIHRQAIDKQASHFGGVAKQSKASHCGSRFFPRISLYLFFRSRICLLYTSPSPRDQRGSRMPSSA